MKRTGRPLEESFEEEKHRPPVNSGYEKKSTQMPRAPPPQDRSFESMSPIEKVPQFSAEEEPQYNFVIDKAGNKPEDLRDMHEMNRALKA